MLGVDFCIIGCPMSVFIEQKHKITNYTVFCSNYTKAYFTRLFFQIFVMLLIKGISISFYRWLLLIDFQNKNQQELYFFMSFFLQEISYKTKPIIESHNYHQTDF